MSCFGGSTYEDIILNLDGRIKDLRDHAEKTDVLRAETDSRVRLVEDALKDLTSRVERLEGLGRRALTRSVSSHLGGGRRKSKKRKSKKRKTKRKSR